MAPTNQILKPLVTRKSRLIFKESGHQIGGPHKNSSTISYYSTIPRVSFIWILFGLFKMINVGLVERCAHGKKHACLTNLYMLRSLSIFCSCTTISNWGPLIFQPQLKRKRDRVQCNNKMALHQKHFTFLYTYIEIPNTLSVSFIRLPSLPYTLHHCCHKYC